MDLDVVVDAFKLDRSKLCAVFVCGSRVYFPGNPTHDAKPKDWDFVLVIEGPPISPKDRCVGRLPSDDLLITKVNSMSPEGIPMEAMLYPLPVFVEYCQLGDYFTLCAAHTPHWARLLPLRPSLLSLASDSELAAHLQPSWPILRRATIHEMNFSQKKGQRLWKRGELYGGKKNLISGLRFLLLAIQLCRDGVMSDFGVANQYLLDILADESTDWDHYMTIFRPIYDEKLEELLAIVSSPHLSLCRRDLPQLMKFQGGRVDPIGPNYSCLLFSPVFSSKSPFVAKQSNGSIFSQSELPVALSLTPPFHCKDFQYENLVVFDFALGDIWVCFFDSKWVSLRLPTHPDSSVSFLQPALPEPFFDFSLLDPSYSYTFVHSLDGVALLGCRKVDDPAALPLLPIDSTFPCWPSSSSSRPVEWVRRRLEYEQLLEGSSNKLRALEQLLWDQHPRRLRGFHLFNTSNQTLLSLQSTQFQSSQAWTIVGHKGLPWTLPTLLSKPKALIALAFAEVMTGDVLFPENLDEWPMLDCTELRDEATVDSARHFISTLIDYLDSTAFVPNESPRHTWYAYLKQSARFPQGQKLNALKDNHTVQSLTLSFLKMLKYPQQSLIRP